MIETTYKTSLTYVGKPNSVGEDDNQWKCQLIEVAKVGIVQGKSNNLN